MRILVVEDNRDILANLADYLSLKGYTVDCAQDGLSGLHLAATEHYDLIVLDVMLPGIDGYALCRRLLIAALVAGGLAWWFARAQRRWPTWGERLRLVALYGGVLGILYLLLVGLASLKGDPSPAALLIVVLHYLCYPALLLVFFSGRVYGFFLR